MSWDGQLGDDIALLGEWLRQGPDEQVSFTDPSHRRLADAVRCWRGQCGRPHKHATELEVAVLIRQALRRFRAAKGHDARLGSKWGLSSQVLSSVGVSALIEQGGEGTRIVNARPWQSVGLGWQRGMPDVDEASLAGLPQVARAEFLTRPARLPADLFFERATGYGSYRTPGQRSAARAAMMLEPGGVLIALLPTGSGKTDVALSLIDEMRRGGGGRPRRVSVIVVPTVALALDLEQRIKERAAGQWGLGRSVWAEPLSWTSDTSLAVRGLIRQRIVQGNQPVLVTSPESLLAHQNELGQALINATAIDRFGCLVIDEAHMIEQWGHGFRPEFNYLADFAARLVKEARGDAPRTLLLSATLTASVLQSLSDSFAKVGKVRLVAGNELRPEPTVWSGGVLPYHERQELLRECLMHLPRPMIVYTTRPQDADEMVSTLKEWGFERSATFTGPTVGAERREVLAGFRGKSLDHGGDEPTEFDVVVATSAFGLGVDYDQVRSIVHACLPETMERWYQEVGRAGRDGYSSVAVLLPTERDKGLGLSMGTKNLEAQTAKSRWQALKLSVPAAMNNQLDRVDEAHWFPMNLQAHSQGALGSYNLKWNRQVLQGMQDLGILKFRYVTLEELLRSDLPTERHGEQIHWVDVCQLKDVPEDFDAAWEHWRAAKATEERERADAITELVTANACLCDAVSETFKPTPELAERFHSSVQSMQVATPCGRCPGCRGAKRNEARLGSPTPIIEWRGSSQLLAPWSEELPAGYDGIHFVSYRSEKEVEILECLQRNGFVLQIVQGGLTECGSPVLTSNGVGDLMSTPVCPTVLLGPELLDTKEAEFRIFVDSDCPLVVLVDRDANLGAGRPLARPWSEFRKDLPVP